MKKEEFIRQNIKQLLTPERFRHSLRVADTAEKLAWMTGVEPAMVRIAALLHDRAKALAEAELFRLAENSQWEIDEIEFSLPRILHAPVSADLAREEFNISDQEVLEAIRFHTIGVPGMGEMAKVIYAADVIEPGRDFPGAEQLRKKMSGPLNSLVVAISNHSIKYNIDQGRLIHPNTLLLRNSLLGGEE